MSDDKFLRYQLLQIIHYKKSNRYYANKLGISVDKLKQLKRQIKYINFTETEKVPENEEDLSLYLEETKKVDNNNGTLESTIVIDYEPRDDKELAKLHKVDLNNYIIKTYWSKLKPNGKFTSSVFCKRISSEDLFKIDLEKNLINLFKDTSVFERDSTVSLKVTNKALFVYIADDHSGIDFKDSLFDSPYTEEIYTKRLEKLANEILNIDIDVDLLYIVNLGDELDGFNKQTTRGGHDLDSLSNREQFDIYVKARKTFYDTLFTSNKFNKIQIININNSNHAGNDYSYVANKALEYYLEARYKNIIFTNQERFIDVYTYGEHNFLLTHGKDEKYMKFGFPLNLNEKTDLWLLDYSKKLKGKYTSTIKGDLHCYSVNMGKSGRYITVPSICGGSNWIEHNYGSSNPGALLEIVEANNKNIISLPIWF